MQNKNIVQTISLCVLIMVCLTFASVPLYRMFCQATGYGGTARIFVQPSKIQGKKTFTISFNADVNPELPWKFSPEKKHMQLLTGENKLAFYNAENLSNKPIVGMASYNVTPELAGKYFNKVQCFCFERQLLKPHQKVLMPVLFFIDPEIENDENLKDIQEITLSYNFYRLKE